MSIDGTVFREVSCIVTPGSSPDVVDAAPVNGAGNKTALENNGLVVGFARLSTKAHLACLVCAIRPVSLESLKHSRIFSIALVGGHNV